MKWDPQQYERFAAERGRPFDELLDRVQAGAPPAWRPAYVVDLGCGPGRYTARVADRWPDAEIVGIDSSPEMVASAERLGRPGRLQFRVGDLAEWQPDCPVDLVVANASLHWVPGHVALLARFAQALGPHGALAFQVPDNFSEPSHVLLLDLRRSDRWRNQLGADADRGASVERPARYLEALVGAGLTPDVWQTEYLHLLPGDDAVLEWVKGTALRPVLSQLTDETERAAFLAQYAEALRQAYPPQPFGTMFPFRRTFAVGRR